MGIINFLKNLFTRNKEGKKAAQSNSARELRPKPINLTASESDLNLAGADLVKMTRRLVEKGKYVRAEQLIRDGVKELADKADIWWLLLEIEEALERIGRVYFCLEKLLLFDSQNEELQNRYNELKQIIDKQLHHFIEYKLAPEFFKLK